MERSHGCKRRKLRKTKFLGEDKFSGLPDHLLCRILSKLSIKDSVRTSVLSKRWSYLWLQVPVIDLDCHKFSNDLEFLECLDRFVQTYKELDLEKFKLVYDVNIHIQDDFARRISDVVKRKVCHLTVLNHMDFQEDDLVRMPLSLYSCETLVNLTLYCVAMSDPMDIHKDNPGSESVSLPCLKTIYLEGVSFDDSSVLKTFISRCTALEDLTLVTHYDDFLKVVSVCSQSLKSFKLLSMRHDCNYEAEDSDDEIDDPDVELDAPRLEYMSISDYVPKSFIIRGIGPSAKLNMDAWFYDESDDTMIRKFLIEISKFREMIISVRSLESIHHYSNMEPVEALPQFSNLSRLDASLGRFCWEFLPTFLGCCINLRSLSVELNCLPEIEEIELSPVPQCVLSTLEFVKLKTKKTTVADAPRKFELVRCFLTKNCPVLKQLIFSEA